MEQVDCPICRQRGIPKDAGTVPDIFFRNSYSIAECPSCGIKRSLYLPDDISTLYAGEVYRSRENRKIIRLLKRLLHYLEVRRLMKTSAAKMFIDVGCGNGDFSRYLFDTGFSVVAADAASRRPSDIEGCSSIPYVHFEYSSGTLDDPELLKGRTVILRHVLEHVTDPGDFLRQLARQGASHFYILVPNSTGLSKRIFGRYEGLWGLPYHVWHFNLRSLKALCRASGLSIVRSGHETIPVFLYSLHRCLVANGAPKFIQNFFKPDASRLILSLPMDILSCNNVVYVVAKVDQKALLNN